MTKPNRTVVKKVDGEWQVRVYINGKFAEGPTYYAADKDDALATQLVMRGELERTYGVRFDGIGMLGGLLKGCKS